MIKPYLRNSLILVVVCLAVYWPVLHLGFQFYWDDHWVVMNNYTVEGFERNNVWHVLTDFYHGQYAPTNNLYYISLYYLSGYNAFWFHLAGLLVHLTNVLLVYFLLSRLMQLNGQLQDVALRRISFLTALLFAIHPFLVESVAWVSASKIILYALFYLIALHFYLSYISTSKIVYYLLTLLFFIISFGAKEQAVVLPICLLLFDYTLQRKLNSRKIWLEKLPFFALALFFGIITMLSQAANSEGMLAQRATYPFYQNIAFASYTITEYATKCLIPVKLSYLYPFPNRIGEPLPARFWIYPIILVLIAITCWNMFKPRWLFFGIAFFLVHIVLASNILPLSRFSIVADRYVYVASIGIFFLVAYCLQTFFFQTKYWKIGLIACVLYVSGLCIYTHERCKIWQDSDTLKQELRDLIKEPQDVKKTNR